MKAWRKHNQKQTARIKELEAELEHSYLSTQERENLEAKIKETRSFRLRNKHERRTQFAAEVATPSYLLLALFKRVGLWTPG
jgi:hypothetical protein